MFESDSGSEAGMRNQKTMEGVPHNPSAKESSESTSTPEKVEIKEVKMNNGARIEIHAKHVVDGSEVEEVFELINEDGRLKIRDFGGNY